MATKEEIVALAQKFTPVLRFAGDEKFFFGSDYPHAEGFVHPIETLRKTLASLPAKSLERIIEQNAQHFFRL